MMFYIDLRSELEIKIKVGHQTKSEEANHSPISSRLAASQPSTISVGIPTSPMMRATPTGTPTHAAIPQPQPITPSARISALNMVGELLRKVGVRMDIIQS